MHDARTASAPSRPGAARKSRAAWRRWLGFAIFLTGLAVTLEHVAALLAAGDAKVHGALVGGGLAATATALGTVPVLLAQRFSQRTFDAMMGFGAGVMLAASAFSLILPALDAAREGRSASGAGLLVGVAVLLGAGAVFAADRVVPHEHFFKGLEGKASSLRRAWLFIAAIVLHNVPEGLSIGIAFGGADAAAAKALSAGIAIQDVPEGLVVALALLAAGYGRLPAAAIGAASGLVEPVAAVSGAALMGLSTAVLPWGLAAAAGAMLYVISHEIIPESHRAGHERAATGGLMLGFVIMMYLDTALA